MTPEQQERETRRILEFLYALPQGLHPAVRFQARLIQEDLRETLETLGVLKPEQHKFNIKLYEAKREQGFIPPEIMEKLEHRAAELMFITTNKKLPHKEAV
jgi:transcriptional regulator of NAD metabolism